MYVQVVLLCGLSWCRPCKSLTRPLEKLAAHYDGSVFLKVMGEVLMRSVAVHACNTLACNLLNVAVYTFYGCCDACRGLKQQHQTYVQEPAQGMSFLPNEL